MVIGDLVESLGAKLFIISALVGALYIIRQAREPRGIKNNNPLNLREDGTLWEGRVGDDGEFIQFDSPVMGIRAGARTLRTYRNKHGINKIDGIIRRWAPPSENDTEAYIRSVEKRINIRAGELLMESDYPRLIAAMIYHENGKQPYSMDVIRKGFNMGFYL